MLNRNILLDDVGSRYQMFSSLEQFSLDDLTQCARELAKLCEYSLAFFEILYYDQKNVHFSSADVQ